MNKHKSNKIKENSNTVRHLIMGQIITTQNLVAIKEVRHAGQNRSRHSRCMRNPQMYVSGQEATINRPPVSEPSSDADHDSILSHGYVHQSKEIIPKWHGSINQTLCKSHSKHSFAVWNLKRRGKFNDTWAHDGRIKTCTRRMKWLHWDYVCYWMICLKNIVPIV